MPPQTIWPAGCRIFLRPQGSIIEDILEARWCKMPHPDLLEIYSDVPNSPALRIVNFREVLLIAPLITVGPSHADD